VAEVPEVLFVCVHNAGRSQMAAALLHHYANKTVRVTSAGSAPAHEINPTVREAMAEIGLDISRKFPKRLTSDAIEAADVVINGLRRRLPHLPRQALPRLGSHRPGRQDPGTGPPIRDDIDARVRALLAELIPASAP
jgi:arsenate reductase